MIEWWQALLIALPSSILGGLVAGGVALVVQRREHRHDGEMQTQRLEADRRGREEEAARGMKRERMQPLFDALFGMEPWILHLAMRETPGVRPELVPEAPSNPMELGERVITLCYRLGDVDLRNEIIDFMQTLVPGTGDARGASLKFADTLSRLEAHVARVD